MYQKMSIHLYLLNISPALFVKIKFRLTIARYSGSK